MSRPRRPFRSAIRDSRCARSIVCSVCGCCCNLAPLSHRRRRQVAYTEWWAEQPENKGVGFYSMHPGWAGTEALKKGMTDFYESTKDKLRTPEQAADTVVWCAQQRTTPRVCR